MSSDYCFQLDKSFNFSSWSSCMDGTSDALVNAEADAPVDIVVEAVEADDAEARLLGEGWCEGDEPLEVDIDDVVEQRCMGR